MKLSNNSSLSNVAFVALGSNQDNPTQQIHDALCNISKLAEVQILKTSGLYVTKPYGYLEQDDFVNAVIKIQTSFTASQLLAALQQIENLQHRVRTLHWGPRTLDLDILAYNHDVINTDTLKIPHPDLYNRPFVLDPWCEIEPAWVLPDGRTIQMITHTLSACVDN